MEDSLFSEHIFGSDAAHTDHQGNYEIMVGTPWIQFIYAEAKGFKRADLDPPDVSSVKHDFVLEKLVKSKTLADFSCRPYRASKLPNFGETNLMLSTKTKNPRHKQTVLK